MASDGRPPPAADARTVDVWWVCPHRLADASALSREERARADAMSDPPARATFTRTRTALRSVLARCTGLAPGEVEFTYGDRGRPAVRGRPDIDFSVSHAERWAVIAVARGGDRIGVDVEGVPHPGVDTTGLYRRFLASDGAPEPPRGAAFARAWTVYEARLKAAGGSLGRPLPPQAALWPTVLLDAPPHHAAALAGTGPDTPPVRVRRTWRSCGAAVGRNDAAAVRGDRAVTGNDDVQGCARSVSVPPCRFAPLAGTSWSEGTKRPVG